MALFIQRAEEEDTGKVVYEVFRRTSKPRDQTVEIVDSKEQAIAVAGRVAEPGESIEEFPEQRDFDFIARGPGAAEETPEPETSDTGGGFFDFGGDGLEFFSDPDQGGGSGGGSGDENGPSDPLSAINSFEDDLFGGEDG